MYPDSIKRLIEDFEKLPGVGKKTAQRYAFKLLDMGKEDVDRFSEDLVVMRERVKHCSICNHLTETDICPICNDPSRNHELVCVVEDSKTVLLLEELGTFNGVYHVLNGLISPIDGVNPEDINLLPLIERVKKESIQEVIITVKPSIEGETTTLYISTLLEKLNIKVTKIAYGVPMGADMEYLDPVTLQLAMEHRTLVHNS